MLLLLRDPAIPVLVLGLVASGLLALQHRLSRQDLLDAVNPVVLGAIFIVCSKFGCDGAG